METSIDITLKAVCLAILIFFYIFMTTTGLVFIRLIFRFPEFRKEFWRGVTDGDDTPHQEDYQRTAQLFWATIFGSGTVTSFLLWAAFPGEEWRYISGGLSVIFLAAIGLRKLSKK